MTFGELPIGATFIYYGVRYTKTGMYMADDSHGHGIAFRRETIVEVVPET